MKCVILGAGATAFCDIANPDRRPPLATSTDFLRMLHQPVSFSVWTSPAGAPLAELLASVITNYRGDLEAVFSDLFELRLGLAPPEHEGLYKLRGLLAKSGALPFSEHLQGQWLLSMAAAGLQVEMAACLGTSGPNPWPLTQAPPSLWHRAIARSLTVDDVVVSFNYDLVMPFAMVEENRLGDASFSNTQFATLSLAQPTSTPVLPVPLITPHGSFAWYGSPNDPRKIGVFLARGRDELLQVLGKEFGIANNIILPFKAKAVFLDMFPVFASEMQRFFTAVGACDEVHLIGKQFYSADVDIAERISQVCSRKSRRVVYANPDSSDPGWVDCHNAMLNVRGQALALQGIADYVDLIATRAGRP